MTKVNESKNQNKKQQKCASIRVSRDTLKKLDQLLALANKKSLGRKVRADQVLSLSIELLVDDHIKLLQNQSLTNEDKREILRQEYIKKHGQTTRDEFLGLMLTGEFQKFLNEHKSQSTNA